MTQIMYADDDEEAHEEFRITAFHCNSFCGSFYSGNGTLDTEALQELTRQSPQQLLGWFMCRRGSWSQPTMLEQQVSAGLLGAMPGNAILPCSLFAIFAPTVHHGGATFSLESRLYCSGPDRWAPKFPVSEPHPRPCLVLILAPATERCNNHLQLGTAVGQAGGPQGTSYLSWYLVQSIWP